MPQSDVSQKNTNLGKPLDPTTDFQGYTGGDQYGHTATTAKSDDVDEDQAQDLEDALEVDADSEDGGDVVSQHAPEVDLKLEKMLYADDTDDALLEERLDGEDTVSGEATDPESDDDTLLMSQQVGLRTDEDYDNPQELNIAADVAAAERSRRGMGNDDDDDDEL